MKKFFSTTIVWIKAHVWKSVIIGVASCAVIATAITLPIVLSNKEEPASEEPSNSDLESPTLDGIAVKTAPTKTTYTVGEYFDPAGLVISTDYSDDSNPDVSYAGNEGDFTFTPSLTTALTTSDTSVTISYGGQLCEQAITVSAPPTPITKYAVSVEEATGGTITLSETGEFEAGKEILVTVTPDACYKFVEITINGEAKSTSDSYLFTVSKDLANDQNKIVVSATFEEDSPTPTNYAESFTFSGPIFVVEGETITITAEPLPAGSEFQYDFVWSITEGDEYVTIVGSTATSVTVRGEYGDHEATIKADDGNGLVDTIVITVEPLK